MYILSRGLPLTTHSTLKFWLKGPERLIEQGKPMRPHDLNSSLAMPNKEITSEQKSNSVQMSIFTTSASYETILDATCFSNWSKLIRTAAYPVHQEMLKNFHSRRHQHPYNPHRSVHCQIFPCTIYMSYLSTRLSRRHMCY